MVKAKLFLFAKELKQRREVRRVIALFLFPLAYAVSFVHPYYGFNMLVKVFLTDLSIFDRLVACRLMKILPNALVKYYSSKPEYEVGSELLQQPEAEYTLLKPYVSHEEKGLISIHWRWQIDILCRNYDVEKIMNRYMIVLGVDCFGAEWTYPFLAILQAGIRYAGAVFISTVDTHTQSRMSYMNFMSIPHGISSDYINPALFNPMVCEKEMDIIMVAHWDIPTKRHYVLFKALEKVSQALNVGLVGFPAGGYTIEQVKKLQSCYDLNHHNMIYYENMSSSSVNTLLNKSKISVITSLMEGGNRACFESFFADVPVIILDENMGIPKHYFNNETGIVCKECELHTAIMHMLDHCSNFTPRKWALSNISPKITAEKMNSFLREYSLKNGMQWTTDLIGKQWLGQTFEYIDSNHHYEFEPDHMFIEGCRRS